MLRDRSVVPLTAPCGGGENISVLLRTGWKLLCRSLEISFATARAVIGPAPPSIESLPTAFALQKAILAAKRGKANGPDDLPGELGLAASGPLCDILYPLVLKLDQEPSALAQEGATEWLQALTCELNAKTWMHLRGDSVAVATRRGTRPGSAWADLTFGVLVRRVLRLRNACRQQLCDHNVVPQIMWDGCRGWQPPQDPVVSLPLDDVDLAACLDVNVTMQAAKVVATETGILADAFAGHSLDLSFGPRKTAAILCLRGAGARSARRGAFHGDACLTVLRESHKPAKLPLVSQYRHLGVIQAPEGKIGPEVRARCAAAWCAFREGRSRIFRCRRISAKQRGVLLDALVMSKLTFGIGAWPPLGKGDEKVFAGAVSGLYRAVISVRPHEDQHLTLATICALVGLVDHVTLIKLAQLRYLRQLVAFAPDVLWALLRGDEPVMADMREALTWLYARVRATSELPDPLLQWEPWRDMMLSRPGLFKGMVKRAKGLESCRIQCIASLQSLHRALLQLCGGEILRGAAEDVRYTEACLLCKKGFASRSAWAMHSSKLHGYRISASVLVGSSGSTLCEGCGKCFSKPARLRRHLLHASKCRAHWESFRLADGVVVPGLHEQHPPLTLEGVLTEGHSGQEAADFHPSLLDSLLHLEAPSAEEVWDLVCEFVEPIAVLRNTVQAWQQHASFPRGLDEVASDVLLMLDPENCCEQYCKPKGPVEVVPCCPELPGPLPQQMAFVLTGAVATFKVDEPPCVGFVYPFVGGAALAAARKQADYVEAACDVVGIMAQASQTSRVVLKASRKALAALEPIPTWLSSVGICFTSEGLASPAG